MEVFFNTDKRIDGQERTEAYFSQRIKATLSHFENRLTRIEAHISDENADKVGGKGKKCILEARPQGLKPIAVASRGETVEKAINDASKKLKSKLNSLLGKLQSH